MCIKFLNKSHNKYIKYGVINYVQKIIRKKITMKHSSNRPECTQLTHVTQQVND